MNKVAIGLAYVLYYIWAIIGSIIVRFMSILINEDLFQYRNTKIKEVLQRKWIEVNS